MCGIFALLVNNEESIVNENILQSFFMKGQKRGPEFSTLKKEENISVITLDDGKANVFSTKMSTDIKRDYYQIIKDN